MVVITIKKSQLSLFYDINLMGHLRILYLWFLALMPLTLIIKELAGNQGQEGEIKLLGGGDRDRPGRDQI